MLAGCETDEERRRLLRFPRSRVPGLNLGPQTFQALICPTPGVRTTEGTRIKGDPSPRSELGAERQAKTETGV
jgi:hypothetical protein